PRNCRRNDCPEGIPLDMTGTPQRASPHNHSRTCCRQEQKCRTGCNALDDPLNDYLLVRI
ncbi:MAG: hypothetical protein JW941_00070, partial [Candidatus Coatesbacteria bacterium]|nr:hypothetical protein [Candidatus Coatesbacteria bacterium]